MIDKKQNMQRRLKTIFDDPYDNYVVSVLFNPCNDRLRYRISYTTQNHDIKFFARFCKVMTLQSIVSYNKILESIGLCGLEDGIDLRIEILGSLLEGNIKIDSLNYYQIDVLYIKQSSSLEFYSSGLPDKAFQ